MSEKYNALLVVLETNLYADDTLPLVKAIEQFRGVLKVTGNVADLESYIAQERARRDLERKLFEALRK